MSTFGWSLWERNLNWCRFFSPVLHIYGAYVARVEGPVKGGCIVFLLRLKVGGEVRGVVTDEAGRAKKKVSS